MSIDQYKVNNLKKRKVKNLEINLKNDMENGYIISTATYDYYGFHIDLSIVDCHEEDKGFNGAFRSNVKVVGKLKTKKGKKYILTTYDTSKELSKERFLHLYNIVIARGLRKYME